MSVDTAATPAGPSTSALTADATHARRWWILAVLGIAQLMVVLDSTIVSIALPTAQSDLGFNNADRQWIVTGYALAFGSLLLIGGRLADFFGRAGPWWSDWSALRSRPPSVALHRTSACSSPRVPCRVRSARCSLRRSSPC